VTLSCDMIWDNSAVNYCCSWSQLSYVTHYIDDNSAVLNLLLLLLSLFSSLSSLLLFFSSVLYFSPLLFCSSLLLFSTSLFYSSSSLLFSTPLLLYFSLLLCSYNLFSCPICGVLNTQTILASISGRLRRLGTAQHCTSYHSIP
jgi:hypothetical protein